MRKLCWALCVMHLLTSGTAWAQAANFPPNEMGVTMGHWHLNSPDVEATKKILVGIGGVSVRKGNIEIVKFPGVAVFVNLAPGAPPAGGGTMGSVINHVGFNVPKVAEAVARWKAAGVEVLPGNRGRTDQAYVSLTDGVVVEILEENENQKFPIEHHHIHFSVPRAERTQMQAWYAKVLGATPAMRGTNIAGELPGANLTFGSRSEERQATTKGRALDHIGFDVTNLEAFCKRLEAAGIKLDQPYTKDAQTRAARAFLYDPWGTYIELNEWPNPL